jgi:hypothetical protein
MKPDLREHKARSGGGLLKIFSALAIPLWAVAMLTLPHPGQRGAKLLIVATVIVVLLPFLATVSAPRFRVPLDFVCWMDLGATLVYWRWMRRQRAERMKPAY